MLEIMKYIVFLEMNIDFGMMLKYLKYLIYLDYINYLNFDYES